MLVSLLDCFVRLLHMHLERLSDMKSADRDAIDHRMVTISEKACVDKSCLATHQCSGLYLHHDCDHCWCNEMLNQKQQQQQ